MANKIVSQTNTSDSGRKNVRGTVIIVLCTICITIIVMRFFSNSFYDGPSKESEQESSRNMVVMEDNIDEIISQFDGEKRPPGRYQVTMNTTWMFKDGKSASSNAYVENVVANNNSVYFDILRSDTGENIFSSPILPVGSHLKNITLDTDLDIGTYPCVLTYTLINEEQQPISTVSVNLDIIIEE